MPFSATMSGKTSVLIHSIGGVIHSAIRSACDSASDFGTISPITMWK